jgi:hypothetical protein
LYHNLYLLYLSQFLALSWNFPLPGNFHSRLLDSIEKQETENETEIVFPSVPPAFMDTKESDRVTAVELKDPASLPKMKRRGISSSMQRNIKKKNAMMPPSCTYLAYLTVNGECQDATIMHISHSQWRMPGCHHHAHISLSVENVKVPPSCTYLAYLTVIGECQCATIMHISCLSHSQWRMPGCHHHARILLISQWRMPGCHHQVRISLISQSGENAMMPPSCTYLAFSQSVENARMPPSCTYLAYLTAVLNFLHLASHWPCSYHNKSKAYHFLNKCIFSVLGTTKHISINCEITSS